MASPAYVFTPVASDNFQRPNENPLNPAKWGLGNFGKRCQLINQKCVTTLNGNFGVGAWIGGPSVPGPNQYVKVTIGTWGGFNSEIDILLQATDVNLDGSLDAYVASDDGINYYVKSFGASIGSLPIAPEFELPGVPQPGDTFLFGTFGTTAFTMYNGILVQSGVLAPKDLGQGNIPAFDVLPNSSITDTSISAIEMGTVSIAALGGGDHVGIAAASFYATPEGKRYAVLMNNRFAAQKRKKKER